MALRIAKRTIFPPLLPAGERDASAVARLVNNILAGKLNVTGEFQALPATASTMIRDPRCGPQSFYAFQALTAQAAERLPSIWIMSRGTGFVEIGHTTVPGAATDCWIEYMVIG